jgi:hypothetical protein
LRRLSVSRPDYVRVAELAEPLSIAVLEKPRGEILQARTVREVRRLLEALEPGGRGR